MILHNLALRNGRLHFIDIKVYEKIKIPLYRHWLKIVWTVQTHNLTISLCMCIFLHCNIFFSFWFTYGNMFIFPWCAYFKCMLNLTYTFFSLFSVVGSNVVKCSWDPISTKSGFPVRYQIFDGTCKWYKFLIEVLRYWKVTLLSLFIILLFKIFL